MQHVTGRVYADTEGKNGGNFGAVVLDDQIVMIDSGLAHTVTRKVRDQLVKESGLPILKVAFTHHHSDHVFGAQAFEQASLIASLAMGDCCREALKDDWILSEIRDYASQTKVDRPDFWVSVQDLRIRTPDILFTGTLTIGRANDMEVKHVGGHTSDSSIVIVEPEHVVFSGDLLFCGTFPYAGDPTNDPEAWIAALQGFLKPDYVRIVPGHGSVCGNDEVVRHLDFFKSLRRNIKRALKRGISVDEFMEQDMIPEYYTDGADKRARSTVERWYDYYGKS